MLNFFVLGLIPGTNLQITFTWFLVLGIIADSLFGIAYLYFIIVLKNSTTIDSQTVSEVLAAN